MGASPVPGLGCLIELGEELLHGLLVPTPGRQTLAHHPQECLRSDFCECRVLWELIHADEFPLDNIAFRLFVDVVSWYHNKSTTQMRYCDITKWFWRTGYKLFKGKFLNFMGGFKNLGDVLSGRSLFGSYSPSESRINFAVPSHRFLQQQSLSTMFPSESIKPGILKAFVEYQMKTNAPDRWYKLCVDGELFSSHFHAKYRQIYNL